MSTARATTVENPRSAGSQEICLVGLAWDDPRGYGPLEATEAAFVEAESVDHVRLRWDIQRLSGFESRSICETARQYDLIVMDHPHTAEAQAAGCLAPLGPFDDEYVGATRTCYQRQGEQWAAPIDASCHVAAWRSGVEGARWTTWDELFAAAQGGLRIGAPLGGVHALMALFSLLGSSGCEVAVDFPQQPEIGSALGWIRKLADRCPQALDWNPLDALAALAAGEIDYVPCTFAYGHFAEQGVAFGSMPAVSPQHPSRAILGGAGLAVSAYSKHRQWAIRFARYAASRKIQQSIWPRHGGQPAHRLAWDRLAAEDPFYRSVRPALETAFVRPAHPRWNAVQSEMGKAIEAWLRTPGAPLQTMICKLQTLAAAQLQ